MGKLMWVRPGYSPDWTAVVQYYIYQPGYDPAVPALMSGPVVCGTVRSTVYRVSI
jgi:hypothetical protein